MVFLSASPASEIFIYGFLLVIGILMAIAGFVLTIVGLAMRPKLQNPDDLMAQYEKKNQ